MSKAPTTTSTATSTSTTAASDNNNNNTAALNAAALSLGNALWHQQSKTNAELVALTYGALVAELIRDLETTPAITAELDRMGHSMGARCMEEFLAKAAVVEGSSSGNSNNNNNNNVIATVVQQRPSNFAATSALLRAGFKMFWGVNVDASPKSESSYVLTLHDNPLQLFVELPSSSSSSSNNAESSALKSGQDNDYGTLPYSQLLCGMIRGMLEVVQYDVTCQMLSSQLQGHATNEMVVDLKQVLQDQVLDEEYHEE